MTRRRLRSIIIWTGTTLCVLIAAAFVASAWWQVAVQVPRPNGPAFYLMSGSILIVTDAMLTVVISSDTHSRGLRQWNAWTFQRLGSKTRRGPTVIVTYIEFPLWLPFLAVAVPTLLVLRFVPKFPSGGCRRCGYDLTGNLSGTCPECGQPSPPGRPEQPDQRPGHKER